MPCALFYMGRKAGEHYMRMGPYNPRAGVLKSHAGIKVDRGFVAHLQIPATKATAADTDGIHAAVACTTPAKAASVVVKAASAATDKLTISGTTALGSAVNALNVLLTTADDDTLAVTKTEATKTINIALANTTAANNAASLIQAAIRTLAAVGGVDVSAFTCAATGNWDTAAVATGETEAVAFSGGQTATPDVIVTDIEQPSIPRSITATAGGGTSGDIGAVKVKIEGTNYADQPISEELAAFTANTPGTKESTKAFKTVTKITIPAHDGTGATTSIGFGEKLGLPYSLPHNTVLSAYLNNVLEATAPTVTTSATATESNTVDLNSSLNSKVVDVYFVV